MRDIKFKCFVERKGVVMGVSSFEFAGDGINIDFTEEYEEFVKSVYFPNKHDVELLQYTGLKDKNGKEIYEGDIVARKGIDTNSEEYRKWMANTDYSDNVDSDLKSEIPIVNQVVDVVTMDRFPIYWLKNESFGYEGEDLEEPSCFEVIGNVYENPELIPE